MAQFFEAIVSTRVLKPFSEALGKVIRVASENEALCLMSFRKIVRDLEIGVAPEFLNRLDVLAVRLHEGTETYGAGDVTTTVENPWQPLI